MNQSKRQAPENVLWLLERTAVNLFNPLQVLHDFRSELKIRRARFRNKHSSFFLLPSKRSIANSQRRSSELHRKKSAQGASWEMAALSFQRLLVVVFLGITAGQVFDTSVPAATLCKYYHDYCHSYRMPGNCEMCYDWCREIGGPATKKDAIVNGCWEKFMEYSLPGEPAPKPRTRPSATPSPTPTPTPTNTPTPTPTSTPSPSPTPYPVLTEAQKEWLRRYSPFKPIKPQ